MLTITIGRRRPPLPQPDSDGGPAVITPHVRTNILQWAANAVEDRRDAQQVVVAATVLENWLGQATTGSDLQDRLAAMRQAYNDRLFASGLDDLVDHAEQLLAFIRDPELSTTKS